MIRLLLITILMVSCNAEVEYADLTDSSDRGNVQNYQLLQFNPQIEMMIMFLWPKDLGPEDEEQVVEIISTSRKIFTEKEKYLENLYKLNTEYSSKSCDCHTMGICDDGQDMDDDMYLVCEEITDRQAVNNMILANLTLEHDYIKEKLAAINAINIDVGVDDDYLDIGSYNINTKILKLNKFGYLGQQDPVKFQINRVGASGMKANFSFDINGETFKGDLGISDRKYNVVFSGEIETSSGFRGLIYWEQLK